jgi:thiamine-phosphate pyrophosphorylase
MPSPVKNETKLICNLLNNGLQILHVRKPEFSKTELKNYLAGIPVNYHKKIVIHSHYSLLKEFNLKGIHLTEKSRKKKLPAYFNMQKHSLSTSFHSIKEIQSSKRKYDYIFLSPVFNSISKKGYKSNFTEQELKVFLKEKKNIIALGGTIPAVMKKLKRMNFKGTAALGFVWGNKNPLKAYRQLASKIK